MYTSHTGFCKHGIYRLGHYIGRKVEHGCLRLGCISSQESSLCNLELISINSQKDVLMLKSCIPKVVEIFHTKPNLIDAFI